MSNTEYKPPGTCVAEGKQTAFNVIVVKQRGRKTVYSKQCGKWKQNRYRPCNN